MSSPRSQSQPPTALARFSSLCLIYQRTGKRCRSCLPRWQNMRYADLVASGRCGQCRRHKFEGGHGKLCSACWERQRARNNARRPGPRRPVTCAKCKGKGHYAKTCDAMRAAELL